MNIKINLDRRLLENFCWPLLFSMLALCACGLLNLYSISADRIFIEEWSWFARQGLYIGLALAGMAVALLVDYQCLSKIIWPVYILSLLSLLAVKFFGISVNNATRWLDLGLFRFQPSEFAKVAVVLALAAWLSKRDMSSGLGFRDLFVPAALIFPPFVLVLFQPDLGTALHLLATCLPVFLAFRFRPQVIVAATVVLLFAATLSVSLLATGSWKVLLEAGLIKKHQVERVETFIDPYKDPLDKGWQIIQAQNAVGGGQLLGRGFKEGAQHKNGFLSEPQTDFAFAVLAEEWGFVGCLVVLALFLCLLSSCLMLTRRCKDRFGNLIALGMTSLLFWQVIINVGMVVGLLPVVGMPLPFISYGGTSLVVTVVAVGLILNIGMHRYLFQSEPIRENPYVWRQVPAEEIRVIVTVPVRRLATDTPFNPELHPSYRLPHIRPWAKYLRKGRSTMSGWQAPDPFEALED